MAVVNLGFRAPSPTPLIYSASDGDPPAITGWTPPIRAHQGFGPIVELGQEINSNILPLDLSLFLFLFFI